MDCLFRVKTVTFETANVTNCHVIATDRLFLSSNHRSVQFLYLAASKMRERKKKTKKGIRALVEIRWGRNCKSDSHFTFTF